MERQARWNGLNTRTLPPEWRDDVVFEPAD